MDKKWEKHAAHQYAKQVVAGEVVAGAYVRKACERYLLDLDTAEEKGLEFRPSTADAYIQFFQKAVKHTVGVHAGKPFDPLPWQQFILWNIYGWHTEAGTRRFNYAFISVGRKNGKTTLISGCALAALFFDQEAAGEIYFAATKRDQAKIGFDEMARMAGQRGPLQKHLEVEKHAVRCPAINARATYVSSDARTLDGLNPHFISLDEYHSHPTDAVFNVMKSGMQSRINPIHMTITTAGFNMDGPCFALQNTCKQILDGIKVDESQFAMIFELDAEDDWHDEATWIKANPSLGATIRLDLLKKQYMQARNMGGSAEVEFKTKHLNAWVQSSTTWIKDEEWMANVREIDTEGLPCWAGLDLASVSDMTALVLIFPVDGGIYVEGHYWLPEAAVQRAMDSDTGHIYAQFMDLPNVHLTEGNVTDYDALRRKISGVMMTPEGPAMDDECLMIQHQIQKVAFDRYNSTQIAINLQDDGVPLVPYGQGFVSMSAPTKEMEILIRSGKLWHNGDPVLRWALANVELRTDPAGNIKPDKGKSSGKIDPVVALIMGLGERMKVQDEGISDDMLDIMLL